MTTLDTRIVTRTMKRNHYRRRVRQQRREVDREATREIKLDTKEPEVVDIPMCRVCFEAHAFEDNRLIQPCQCIGSMKWIHEQCLDQSRILHPLACTICRFAYVPATNTWMSGLRAALYWMVWNVLVVATDMCAHAQVYWAIVIALVRTEFIVWFLLYDVCKYVQKKWKQRHHHFTFRVRDWSQTPHMVPMAHVSPGMDRLYSILTNDAWPVAMALIMFHVFGFHSVRLNVTELTGFHSFRLNATELEQFVVQLFHTRREQMCGTPSSPADVANATLYDFMSCVLSVDGCCRINTP